MPYPMKAKETKKYLRNEIDLLLDSNDDLRKENKILKKEIRLLKKLSNLRSKNG